MKISHELPLSLMYYGYKFNDYDYCLPIFLDRYEQYRLYFQKARLDKRFIIMDNSLFEGYTHTIEDLLDKINLVRPNVFIVPDAWNNAELTIANAKEWIINYKSSIPEEVDLMAVCQGNTIDELIDTYKTLLDLGYKYIAFNHSSVAYINFYPKHTPLYAQMYGRIELIRKLIQTEAVDKNVYHHLLGASDWKEFQAYTEFDWINSLDTSAPIINGAEDIKFDYDTNYNKPQHKLEYYMEMDLNDKLDCIKYNVELLKKSIS